MSPGNWTETPETPLPAGAYRKPQLDLVHGAVGVCMVAVFIGILFLYLEMDFYEFKIEGGPPVGEW